MAAAIPKAISIWSGLNPKGTPASGGGPHGVPRVNQGGRGPGGQDRPVLGNGGDPVNTLGQLESQHQPPQHLLAGSAGVLACAQAGAQIGRQNVGPQPVAFNGVHLIGVAEGAVDLGGVEYRGAFGKSDNGAVRRTSHQLDEVHRPVGHGKQGAGQIGANAVVEGQDRLPPDAGGHAVETRGEDPVDYGLGCALNSHG